jgi:hypothetical protein
MEGTDYGCTHDLKNENSDHGLKSRNFLTISQYHEIIERLTELTHRSE